MKTKMQKPPLNTKVDTVHEEIRTQIPTTGAPHDKEYQLLSNGKPLNDPHYPARAGVNTPVEMSYADAIAKKERGELTKPVLTEQGWVTAV